MIRLTRSFKTPSFLLALFLLSMSACQRPAPSSSARIPAPSTTVISATQTPSTSTAGNSTITAAFAGQPPGGEVWLFQLGVNPEVITIKVGDTVTWVCWDTIEYTIISFDDLFTSPVLTWGSRWGFTFLKPGQFRYRISDDMNQDVGTVVVLDRA
jgi:plastocyanin